MSQSYVPVLDAFLVSLIKFTRPLYSSSPKQISNPPDLSYSKLILVSASRVSENLGHLSVASIHHSTYSGIPLPFDCTQTSPKFPRDAVSCGVSLSIRMTFAFCFTSPYAKEIPIIPPPITITSASFSIIKFI